MSQDMVLGQPTSACVSKRCIVQAERMDREATNVDYIYVSCLVEGTSPCLVHARNRARF